MTISIELLFKAYFAAALILFLFTYSQRYKLFEKINILAFTVGAFFLLSYSSELIVFCSMVLMAVSTFGFVLTRIRPDKQTITGISLSLILILLYKVSPHVSIVMLSLIAATFCFRANNKAIEAFGIILIFPALLYLSINYIAGHGTSTLFPLMARVIGLSFIAISTISLLSDKLKEKRMASYAFFYIGHFIFAMGVRTPETMALSVMLAFMVPLIYSPYPTMISVFNLSMLPVSPVFIIKVILLMIVIKGGMFLEAGIIIICSLVVMGLSTSDLSNIVLQPSRRKITVPVLIQTMSVAVLLLSIIYLDTVKNVIRITMRGISG
jgi:hypothetical protein